MSSLYPFKGGSTVLQGSQLVRTDQAQTFTGAKTFSDNVTVNGTLTTSSDISLGSGSGSVEMVLNKGADSSTESSLTFQRSGTTTFQIGELEGSPASLDLVNDSEVGIHVQSGGALTLDNGLRVEGTGIIMWDSTENLITFGDNGNTQFYLRQIVDDGVSSDVLRIETNAGNGLEMSAVGDVTFERDVTLDQDLTVTGTITNIVSQGSDSNTGTTALDAIDVGSNLVGALTVTVYNSGSQNYTINFTSPSTSNIVMITPRDNSPDTFSYGVTFVSSTGYFVFTTAPIGTITDFTFSFYYQIIPCTSTNNFAWA